MKFAFAAALIAALSAAFAHAADRSKDQAPAPRYGVWGLDLSARDLGVKPGDDFYAYAQGKAVQAMQIPADRSRFGVFDLLSDLSERRSRAVLEGAMADPKPAGDAARIAALYRAFLDEPRVEALDARPLQGELAAIRRAGDHQAIAALMGRAKLGFGSSLFVLEIAPDAKSPDRYVVHLGQGGLGLPDRDYYLQPGFAAQKTRYEAYVAQELALIGWPDAAANAKAIVALETRIAEASWPRSDRRDRVRTYNPMSPAELQAAAPGFAWPQFLRAAGLKTVRRLIVDENTAAPRLAAIFASTPAPTLQAWLAFGLADNASPYLSKRFVDANFEFRDKVLSGQLEPRARWKRGVVLVDDQIGEALGRFYVTRYFPPEAEAKMQALVAELRAALRLRIQRLDWMSPQTKAQALDKLDRFNVKIGYPDRWRDYSGLKLSANDLYGDVERAVAFDWRRQLGRLNRPVDRSEWGITPPTVNAYYSSVLNEVVFPAAILQPPFFDPSADMAVNYGAIGAVIGHEMTHGFDDQGRKSDGQGRLHDWWTAKDAAKFDARAKTLGAQYAAVEPLPGEHINAELTMGENIADLGGLVVGLDAYHASLKGKPAPVIDGLTGDQRVFLGWAQVWRSKMREDALRRRLVVDPHSPEPERVDIPVRNIDDWYAAFDVKPGDKLYLPPDKRAHIW